MDIKAAVKAAKAALDAGRPAEAAAAAKPLLAKAGALEAMVEQDASGKQRTMAYTLCAFAGLALAQLRQQEPQAGEEAESAYLRATRLQPEQFPAWKGLYDLYTAQQAPKEKIKSVLEKLTPAAPPSLKKVAYASQLVRLQLEDALSSGTTDVSSATTLADTVASLLSDPTLAVPAESKDKARDGAEVARVTLELRVSSLLAAEAVERAEKATELRVRMDRQMAKYRDERAKADKLRAQQAASKAGAAAAAVKGAKAAAGPSGSSSGAVVLSQAEEEADLARRVTLKLERDFLEKQTIEPLAVRALATPAAAAGAADPNHLLVHEHLLSRAILRAHATGAFTAAATSEVYLAAVMAIESKAREIVALTSSPFACRVLFGLEWSVGGAGSSADAKERQRAAVARQAAVERSLAVMSAADAAFVAEWGWMGWHALASAILASEALPNWSALPAPPAPLAMALAALGASPSVFEVAEAIVRNVAEPEAPAPAAASAASSSAAPSGIPASYLSIDLTRAPSPLVPSFLSSVTLAVSLARQGEARTKEALPAIQTALNGVKAYRGLMVHDGARANRATNAVQLALASCYALRTLDERMLESAQRLYAQVAKSVREAASSASASGGAPDVDYDALVRALQGQASVALSRRPPDFAAAEAVVAELVTACPEDDSVWSLRGVLALQESRALEASSSAAAPAAGPPTSLQRLRDAESFFSRAAELNPSVAVHQLRLGQVCFELLLLSRQGAGFDSGSDLAARSRAAFERAADLARASFEAAKAGSVAHSSARSLLSDSLALQGRWFSEVGTSAASANAATDADAARKAFVASLKVDPSNAVSGPALCELLEAGASPSNVSKKLSSLRLISEAAVKANPRCVWAWARLARCQVAVKDQASAIVSYQNALRIEGGDSGSGANNSIQSAQCWQELSDCYNAEGQFVAAFKAIARATELSSEATARQGADAVVKQVHEMNLFMLAKMQLTLGGASEAIKTLEGMVASFVSASSAATASKRAVALPALKLLAEALYVHAQVLVQQGAFEAAYTVLERAVSTAQRCLAESQAQQQGQEPSDKTTQLISVWKLLGDCFALYNALPVDELVSLSGARAPPLSAEDIAAITASLAPHTAQLPLAEQYKLGLLEAASKAYLCAAEMDQLASAEYLYDAALSQFKAALALHAPAAPASSDDTSAESLAATPLHPLEASYRARGVELVKKALVLRPENGLFWQLLAVLDERVLVRQHAFLAAIKAEPEGVDAAGAMAWTNLGLAYLQHSAGVQQGEARQALLGVTRHALEVAQTLDPANPSLWSAQGLFNKGVGTLEAYVQARACFQRSLELYPTCLARFGAAYCAYCTGDLAVARFHATKFVQQYPRHSSAWNLLGLVLEQVDAEARFGAVAAASAQKGEEGSQMVREAVEAFVKAEQLLAVDTQLVSEQQRADLLRSVRVNRARALASAGLLDDSAQLYQSLIEQAAAQMTSGAAPSALVLAAAVTLHVDLALVYARQNALEQACAIQATAVAIAAQQIALLGETDEGGLAPEALAQLRGQKHDLVLKRRVLLLENAQLHAQHKQYDTAKTLLQQSVSEHSDFPHPSHYFRVMAALFAVCLAQNDLPGAKYAESMMASALQGLQSHSESTSSAAAAEESEAVMNELAPTLLRVQAALALLERDVPRARRCYTKLVRLNPTALEGWNELYELILSQHAAPHGVGAAASAEEAASHAPVEAILATASLPALDVVHSCRQSEGALLQRLELVALALLSLGRVGAVSASASAAAAAAAAEAERRAAESERRVADALFKPASEADEDAEYNDLEGHADEDVRAKQSSSAAQLQMLLSEGDEQGPRQSNLNSSRMVAHLIHMDPARTSAWGVAAASTYAQAVQLSVVEGGGNGNSGAAAAPILFSKAIKLLQLHTSLLTSELTSGSLARANPHAAQPRHAALMQDLCNTQVLLVDCLLRRSQYATSGAAAEGAADPATDLQQAAQLLQSIQEQQRSMGDSFPLSPAVLAVLSARLAQRQGADSAVVLGFYRAAIEAQPMALELWEEMAEVYGAQSQGEAAAQACLQAPLQLVEEALAGGRIGLDAAHSMRLRVYLRLSLRCYAAHSFAAAAEWSSRATRETGPAGSASAAAFFLQGLAQAGLAHHDQALRALQTALNLVAEARGDGADALSSGAGALRAAGASTPLQGLKFHMALLFLRQASASASTSNGALGEAQALLREELQQAEGVSASSPVAAPILFQLALASAKLKDTAAAQGYIASALQLRPNNAAYVKMQRELASGAAPAASHPEKWDE